MIPTLKDFPDAQKSSVTQLAKGSADAGKLTTIAVIVYRLILKRKN
jgi:hypothetical protein